MNTLRRRLLLVVTAAFALLAISPCLFFLYLYQRVDGVFEAHRAEIATLLNDVPVRNASRAALLGPPEPGNVWEILLPALNAVGELQPLAEPGSGTYDETWDANFDWRGIPAETHELIQQATPALEACRRAMRRSSLDWSGPADPYLAFKTGRICRALCTKGAYAWQAGRDAEATEWLTVALGVAQDAARLGQARTWGVLRVVEHWVCLEARLGLSNHALTAAELDEFALRLDRLSAQRPPLILYLRLWGAGTRDGIFGEDAKVVPLPLEGDYRTVPLESTAGWKDLWSGRICKARVLNGVRQGCERMGAAAAEGLPNLVYRAHRVRESYPAENIAQFLPANYWFEEEETALVRLLLLRLAVGVARTEIELGRFPLSFAEVGLNFSVRYPIKLEEEGINAQVDSINSELLWTIRRRTKD